MWSPLHWIFVVAPENASVTMSTRCIVFGRSMVADSTMWPSAPQSSIEGIFSDVEALDRNRCGSGGCGGGFRWGGDLALSENAGCLLG